MSQKEILDLRSQAEQYKARARDLEGRANAIEYKDTLERFGLVDGQVVEYEGNRLKITGIERSRLVGHRVKKDGEISDVRRIIYQPEKIAKAAD